MTLDAVVSSQLQIFAVVVLTALVAWVVYLIRYHRLSLRDSLMWLLSTGTALLVAVFPELLTRAARGLGVAIPSNALFAFAFLYILLNLLVMTVAISGNSARLRRITQECALLRAEIDALRRHRSEAERETETEP